MSFPQTPDADLIKSLEFMHLAGGSLKKAAALADMNVNTFKSRLYLARTKFPNWAPGGHPVAEAIPSRRLPFEERLALIKRRNAQAIAHTRAKDWQKVHIPINGPYGLCWFGDPHLDDDYCDIESVERHGRMIAGTEGMFGINGGDSINNWVGRLQSLYANQSTTVDEAWELVDWFMNKLGIRWAAWILGNHDVWNEGARVFEVMNQGCRIVMRDWEAKLSLVSPDGSECRIWARHDFKGTSIYNELHGQKRAAMFSGGLADIYAAFHRHSFATGQGELDNGRQFTLVRARGYKECDRYAMVNGFSEQGSGQSVVTVIDPSVDGPPRVSVFRDVEEGCDFLRFKRAKRAL